mgnify:CR=1 FL=1
MEREHTSAEVVNWTWASLPEIVDIQYNANKIRLSFNTTYPITGGALASDRWFIYSSSVESSTTYNATYSTPYTTKQILNAEDTYLIEKEYHPNNLTNYRLRSNRPNLEGVVDYITNYQFLYDQRLQPARRVDLTKLSSKTSISAQHLIELDKALSQAGITGHSMAKFRNNFVIGRALALGNATYDARNKDFNLQVNYEEDDAPTKPHLWCMFVAHIRRIEMKNNSVQLII